VTALATEPTLRSLLEAIEALRAGSDASRNLAVLELEARGGEMTPLHVHEEDEAFHVLEGVIVIHAGERNVRLEAGDAFTAPAGVAHAVGVVSDHARYLATTFARSVSGYAEFLRAAAPPVGAPTPEDTTTVAAIAVVNGIAVLGPPGTLPHR
jgi:quercetin dioxygenase-like cupin family protein